MAKCDCTKDCTECACSQRECDWYIKDEEHFNCFLVYKHFIKHKHTLQEVAKKLELSHTKIKLIEEEAIQKLKSLLENNKEYKDL